MKQTISIPVYYHINDNNKIVIDYDQMEEHYKIEIGRFKLEIESTNKKYK